VRRIEKGEPSFVVFMEIISHALSALYNRLAAHASVFQPQLATGSLPVVFGYEREEERRKEGRSGSYEGTGVALSVLYGAVTTLLTTASCHCLIFT
jgi:hypothetical protein